eukprot:SAG11_NODE_23458_length_388_cov_0.892734_2_plen_28_part_01
MIRASKWRRERVVLIPQGNTHRAIHLSA